MFKKTLLFTNSSSDYVDSKVRRPMGKRVTSAPILLTRRTVYHWKGDARIDDIVYIYVCAARTQISIWQCSVVRTSDFVLVEEQALSVSSGD